MTSQSATCVLRLKRAPSEWFVALLAVAALASVVPRKTVLAVGADDSRANQEPISNSSASASPAREETAAMTPAADTELSSRERKARRFADRLLEEANPRDVINALRKIAGKSRKMRELYYRSVVRSARERLEHERQGPNADRVRFILCGSETCTPAEYGDRHRLVAKYGTRVAWPSDLKIECPERLTSSIAEYNDQGRQARIEGVVIMQAILNSDGTIRQVWVLEGLPLGLTEAAVSSIKRLRYAPSRRNDAPIDLWMIYSTNFRLQ